MAKYYICVFLGRWAYLNRLYRAQPPDFLTGTPAANVGWCSYGNLKSSLFRSSVCLFCGFRNMQCGPQFKNSTMCDCGNQSYKHCCFLLKSSTVNYQGQDKHLYSSGEEGAQLQKATHELWFVNSFVIVPFKDRVSSEFCWIQINVCTILFRMITAADFDDS